ncbi:MAG TPA: hypothetical protein VMD75_01580 [Candidatus Binataceae bacterium]|nr:hypothetical protein [Candidatus Binataceae bacterium]
MSIVAACALSRRVIPLFATAVLLLLGSSLHAESLLDKALDSPPAGSAAATNPVSAQTQPLAPVAYKIPSGTSGSSSVRPAVETSPSPASGPAAAAGAAHTSALPAAAPAKSSNLGGFRTDASAVIDHLDPLSALDERRFRTAAAEFPAFCHDWQQKLSERTRWNLNQISWHLEHGLESGTYTGYGVIDSCTTKLSRQGIPVGKLSYVEYTYALTGKTIEDAKHAQPKQVSTIRTLEIFSFDHNKWFE